MAGYESNRSNTDPRSRAARRTQHRAWLIQHHLARLQESTRLTD